MHGSAAKPKQRYEVGDVLGQGGMGVVHRAFDRELKREVALKTIHNALDKAPLELFRKECSILALLNHPNIVDIYDIGELEENGQKKPYFVMPLLRGATLDQLIRNPSRNLTPDRVVDIFKQACRGLHAAHERGLIHRDLKPSNIFVLDDDSVKIIDFGVAHMVDTHTTMGIKGTLYYMSPEQLSMRPVTPASDIFSMGVVCYESLALRRPFAGGTHEEIARAILEQTPPPVSEFQPNISRVMSQVVQKALAKQPVHRFANARDFASTLEKASRGERLEMFDDSKVAPRISRARTALTSGDTEFAKEILRELDAGGYFAPEITLLRREISRAERNTKIRRLLATATKRVDEQEYQLALQKVDDVLQLEPENAKALTLKSEIEEKRSTDKIDKWLKLARQHLENRSYTPAREALEKVFELKPKDTRAMQLAAEIGQKEQQHNRLREEKQELHQAALDARERGDISAALSRLEKLVDLDKQAPEISDADSSAGYQKLYNEVRSEHHEMRAAYDEARGQLEIHGNIEAALEICEGWLEKYPNHALFQALQFDIHQRRSQDLSAYIAKIDREVENEADLDRRVAILTEALGQYPGEPHFQRALELTQSKRDLVQSIVAKARGFEERAQFSEALGQWEILKTIYSQYPGLQIEIERLEERRKEHKRQEEKARRVEQIDSALELHDFDRAVSLVTAALEEFPDDGELIALEKAARQGDERRAEASRLFQEGRRLCEKGKTEEGLNRLREAYSLDDHSSEIRSALLEALLALARPQMESNWQAAESMVREALDLDPGNAMAKSLMTLAEDRRRTTLVDKQLTEAREKQLSGDLEGALAEVKRGLANYPDETRLVRLHASLEETYAATMASPPPQQKADVKAAPSEVKTPPAHPLPSPKERPAKPKKPATAAPRQQRSPWPVPKGVFIAAAALAVVLVAVIALVRFQGDEPSPSATELALTTTPPDAEVLIDGQIAQAPFLLEPGSHTIEVRMPGYEAASETIVVEEGTPPNLHLALTPLETSIDLVAELDAGSVALNGEPAGELEDGVFELAGLAPGEHTLKFSGGRYGEATLTFESRQGAAPRIVEPPATKELQAVVVTSYLGTGYLHSSLGDATVSIDDREVGQLTRDGLTLWGLSAGSHELKIGDRQMDVEIPEAPALFLSLLSDRTVGHMLLVTNQPSTAVYINGNKYHRTTDDNGRIRLTNLEVKTYAVRLEKEGFKSEENEMEVTKGRTSRWVVDLSPLPPQPGTLTIAGGPAGAEVHVDGRPAGRIKSDGTLTLADVSPGSHQIEISKSGYRTKTVEKDLVAGGAISLTAEDVSLDVAAGALVLDVSPASANLLVEPRQVQSNSESKRYPKVPSRLQLPVGQYSLTFSASGYEAMTVNVELVDRETKTIPIELARRSIEKKIPTTGGMEGFTSGGWTERDGWQTRRGGGFVLYKSKPSAGAFAFTVRPPAGGIFRKQPPLQWVANYTDNKNYVLFRIDGKNFYRFQVEDGASRELTKKPHGLNSKKDCQITVRISPAAIVHTVSMDGRQTELDSWNSPDGDFSAGQFGFRVPGDAELRLKQFAYRP